MIEILLELLKLVVSAGSVGLSIWLYSEKKREKEIESVMAKMEALRDEMLEGLLDVRGAMSRNTGEFHGMRESFAVYRSKLDDVQRVFEKNLDRIDREMEKLEKKIDRNSGRVIRKE